VQVNDALIAVAVCASKEREHTGKTADADADRITDLARQHPLF
jgi:hypothetical protein